MRDASVSWQRPVVTPGPASKADRWIEVAESFRRPGFAAVEGSLPVHSHGPEVKLLCSQSFPTS